MKRNSIIKLLDEIRSFYAEHSPINLTRKIEPPSEAEKVKVFVFKQFIYGKLKKIANY